MAFPTGWAWKCSLTIPSGQVSAELADFPVLLTQGNLPSQCLDADGAGPALSGGGDLRFSSDADGFTQLACEVVTFTTHNTPASAVAQVWVKLPSVANGSDTVFYVWWGKAAETQPAASDTYGSQAVWSSSFVGVWHMGQDPSGSAPQVLDSTANGYSLTAAGSMTSGDLVAATIGNGIDFDGSDDKLTSTNPANAADLAALTLTFWAKTSTAYQVVFGRNAGATYYWYLMTYGTNRLYFGVLTSGTPLSRQTANNAFTSNTLQHWAATWDGSLTATNVKFYVDGTEASYSTTTNGTGSRTSDAGSDLEAGTTSFTGVLDELRLASVVRTVGWVLAEKRTGAGPASFVTAGTPYEIPPEGVYTVGAALTLPLAEFVPGYSPLTFEIPALTANLAAFSPVYSPMAFEISALTLGLSTFVPAPRVALTVPKWAMFFWPRDPSYQLNYNYVVPVASIALAMLAPGLRGKLISPKLSLALTLPGVEFVWTVPAGLRITPIYRLTLTGAPDATTDVELPLESFQGRIRADDAQSYLSVVIPDAYTYAQAVADRPAGELVLRKGVRMASGAEMLTEIARVSLDEISDDRGGNSASLTLTGWSAIAAGAFKTRTLTGVSYRHGGSGLRRVRASFDTFLRPGDTAVFPELGGESLTVGSLSYTVGPLQEVMEITEAEA